MTSQNKPRPFASPPCNLHELDPDWLSFEQQDAPEKDDRLPTKEQPEEPET